MSLPSSPTLLPKGEGDVVLPFPLGRGTEGARWAFAEFTEVYQIEADFEKKVEAEYDKMIEQAVTDKN